MTLACQDNTIFRWRSKLRKKYTKYLKIWGDNLHWRPPLQILGDVRVPPRSPKVYASVKIYNEEKFRERYRPTGDSGEPALKKNIRKTEYGRLI